MKISLVDAWYSNAKWLVIFKPLSMLFGWVSRRRKAKLLQAQQKLPVPVVVVGNITVGGTGKTPVVSAVADFFIKQGLSPVIISRGYGGSASEQSYPLPVLPTSDPKVAGDEPVMLSISAGCPVIVDPKRLRAAEYALKHYDCDVIISDDGMQHYALPRDFEIAVIDGFRGFGNEQLIPQGPLRESVDRLTEVDAILVNGISSIESLSHYYQFELLPMDFVNVSTGEKVLVSEWVHQESDQAIAGIGNPSRFEATLIALGAPVSVIPLPDHHPISRDDIPNSPRVIMTQKDAVKCRNFNDDRLWYLRVKADLPRFVLDSLLTILADR